MFYFFAQAPTDLSSSLPRRLHTLRLPFQYEIYGAVNIVENLQRFLEFSAIWEVAVSVEVLFASMHFELRAFLIDPSADKQAYDIVDRLRGKLGAEGDVSGGRKLIVVKFYEPRVLNLTLN